MKVLKKFLCVVLVCVFGSTACCVEGSALYPNTHVYLGKKMLEQYSKTRSEPSSENKDKAFLSGLFYADIGKFKFDEECEICSDSKEFVEEMKKHIETDEECSFVRGWSAHVFQDKKTGEFLSNIFGKISSDSEFDMNNASLDKYCVKKAGGGFSDEFLDKLDVTQLLSNRNRIARVRHIPFQIEATAMNIYRSNPNNCQLPFCKYGDLIRKTYKAFGLELSLDDIYEQAANVVEFCVVLDVLRITDEIPENIVQKIEPESDEQAKQIITVELCYAIKSIWAEIMKPENIVQKIEPKSDKQAKRSIIAELWYVIKSIIFAKT